MQKIMPCLWFDHQAEEAVTFYTSIFNNSNVVSVAHYGDAGAEVSGKPKGSVMSIIFQLEGQHFMALNGGPEFTFSPAISLLVNCQTQEELDQLWDKMTQGGEIEQCGWLRDKFGVSWQIVPAYMEQMMTDPNPDKSNNVMKAMLQMKKIDFNKLKQAYER